MGAELDVIFVDFDGVLHPEGIAALDENRRLIANPALFCWRPVLESALALHPSVRIVVSSDWRGIFDDENLRRLLGPILGSRMLGVVDTCRNSRAEEILAEAARRQLARWLAVDDHPSVVDARRAGDTRFIPCSPDTGLSSARVQRELRRKLADLDALGTCTGSTRAIPAFRPSEDDSALEAWTRLDEQGHGTE